MDNAAARATAYMYNPEHHNKVKHIERRHFYIRDMVEALQIEVPYVPTDENIADFFTKPLAANKFFPMRDRIMGVPGARDSCPRVRSRQSLGSEPSRVARGG